MTWFLVYLFNLRTPILMVAVMGIAICAIIAYWASGTRSQNVSGSSSYMAATERQMVCLKAALGLALLAAFVWAIPSPEYDVRYKIKEVPVVKKVPVRVYSGVKVIQNPSTYQSVYDSCISSTSYRVDPDTMKLCHEQAMTASNPAQQVKVVYKFNSFKELYDNCNNGFTIRADTRGPNGEPPAMIRNQRIELCGKIALEGSRTH